MSSSRTRAEEAAATPFNPDWPLGALMLLAQAKQGAELVKLILAGTTHVDAWLIENRILPALQDKGIGILHFELKTDEKRAAALAPLPDGSAFLCNASGIWSAHEAGEMRLEIEYIGKRFAPGDRWLAGFSACIQQPDNACQSLTPDELANYWESATGSRPPGFDSGAIDQMKAYGLDVMDKVFHTQGRLGL